MHPLMIAASMLMGSTVAAAPLPSQIETGPEMNAPQLRVPWTEPSGRGLGIGYENGAFGETWAQGLRVQVPITSHFSINLRGLGLLKLGTPGNTDLGGRLELIGRSPVFLNLVRLYGGGGVQAFREVDGANKGKNAIGGGGQFGFELFMHPRASFFLEVGGNSGGAGGLGAGATTLAGFDVYL